MTSTLPFASLASIDAVVLDTETTGLDARVARAVQVGAITIKSGRLDRGRIIDQLIDPTIDIPAETTRVHGISRADVAGKPDFKTFAPELKTFIGDRLLIGHTIGYDLTILQSEHRRAGLAWQPVRALDIRALARVASPGLASHSLDHLCEWLGVENARRHSAIGDAIATAEIFLKLVPLLRQKGVRTLAEAEKACIALAETDARAAGGLMAVDLPLVEEAAPLARLDVFAYRHRVRDVMTSPAMIVPQTVSVGDAIGLMLERGLSSVFVELAPDRTGIMTERDALRALHLGGAEALARRVGEIAKHPLQTVAKDDHVYRAIGRLERLGFRHLGVHDQMGTIVGALTPRNLLRNRATTAIAIGDGIAAATTPAHLAASWNEVPVMALNLVREGVDGRTIAGVISAEIRAMTRRAAELAEDEMEAAGKGRAPTGYAVLVLGSAGRGESLIAADQDNAIVFEAGAPGGPEDVWFEQMATRMNAMLDLAGIDFCKGGVMARSADWRAPLDGWRQRVGTWIRRQRPEDLLNVDIFFDADVVAGDGELGRGLMQEARASAGRAPDFLKMLTELARRWRSPIGLLGGFHKTDGRVDLKMGGLLPIVTGARVLALRHGIAAPSTEGRLRALIAAGIGSAETIERILAAHETLLTTVLRQQLEDGRRGIALSPRVETDRLSKAERRRIKAAIEAVPDLIDLVSEGRI